MISYSVLPGPLSNRFPTLAVFLYVNPPLLFCQASSSCTIDMGAEQLCLQPWSQFYFSSPFTAVKQNSCSELSSCHLSRETMPISLVIEILRPTPFLEPLPFLHLSRLLPPYVSLQLNLLSADATLNIEGLLVSFFLNRRRKLPHFYPLNS